MKKLKEDQMIKGEWLQQHLHRISCGGQVREAVFEGAFRTQALTADYLLLVIAPELEDALVLEEPIGISELDVLSKAVGIVSTADDDGAIDIMIEDLRLVVLGKEGRRVCILTAEPRTIQTRIENTIVTQLLEKVGSTTIPLGPDLVGGIKRAFSGLRAAEVEIIVSPRGGMIRVGEANSNIAEFPSSDLCAEKEYSLVFGQHFIDVLSTLTEPAPVLYVGGQHVAVQDGDYQYILSPRGRSADQKAERKVKDDV